MTTARTQQQAEQPAQPAHPARPAPAIRIDGLSKCYRLYARPSGRFLQWMTRGRWGARTDFWALKGFTLEVARGECVGIIGPNGAGKSTLLKIISGTRAPTGGTYQLTGRVLSLLELGTGLNPELTGRENVRETAMLLGFPVDETVGRMADIEAFAGLGEFFDRPIRMYSSGMSVRLAFSMFVFMRPDVLIVDEALAVGDVGFQRKCYTKLEELLRGGMTCLFVTHDLGAVVRFCSRAVVLLNGEKVYEGEPARACNVLNKFYFGESAVEHSLDYGDGSATIDRIWFEDADGHVVTMASGRAPLSFCYSCRFNRDVEDPVFGFHCKTVNGVEVCTASTDHMGRAFGSLARGERLTLKWALNVDLNPGAYFFGCGCRHADGSRFMSRRVDAVRLPVVDNPTFGGIVNMFRELNVTRSRDADSDSPAAPAAAAAGSGSGGGGEG
jgi:lipopolysaccharide transport system ATP-binding protein